MSDPSQQTMAYRRALLRAVGLAPTLEDAARAFAVLNDALAPFPEVFAEQFKGDLPSLLRENPQAFLFQATSDWFDRGDYFAELGWAALSQKCQGVVGPWLKHPNTLALATGPRGERFLERLILGEVSPRTGSMLVKMLLDNNPWSQNALDRALSAVVQCHKEAKWSDDWFSVWNRLLHQGANPCALYIEKPKPTALNDSHHKNEKHAPDSIAMALARSSAGNAMVPAALLAGLVDHGKSPQILERNPKFVHTWLGQGGLRPGVVSMLEKCGQAWWDGDPFGVVRYIAADNANNTTLMVAMVDAAKRHGVSRGLAEGSEQGIFRGLFQASLGLLSSPNPDEASDALAAFWRVQAPHMSVLWKDGSNWAQLCKDVNGYLGSGHRITRNDATAWFQGLLISQATPQANAKSTRRSL